MCSVPDRQAGGWRARGVLVAVLAVAATLLGTSADAVAQATDSCDASSGVANVTRWTGDAGDDSWHTAGNWDNGVPDATKIACITKDGTYTVEAGTVATASAESLELGGASGTQVLQVFGA